MILLILNIYQNDFILDIYQKYFLFFILITRNRILSPGLENTRTLKWIYDSFPGTLTYMLSLEYCWNSAPMCSFSPIQGTMS